MSSDLTEYEKRILQRLINRKNVVSRSPRSEKTQESSGESSSSGVKVFGSVSSQFPFTVEDLVKRGNDDFYDNSKNTGKVYAGLSENASVGVLVSLEKCLNWARDNNGVVASMPYLIAGMSKASSRNYLRNYLRRRWHTALSEENVGIDTKGVLRRNKPIVVVVHGGGILTPERIRKAYDESLTSQGAAKYTPDEWDDLLDGRLPDGERIQIYTVDDVKNGKVAEPFGRYAVAVDFKDVKATSKWLNKTDFMKNPLVLARAGTVKYLEKYFDKVEGIIIRGVGNWHWFNEIDFSTPQGTVLQLYSDSGGLSKARLSDNSCFVGVAPKAQGSSPRKWCKKVKR